MAVYHYTGAVCNVGASGTASFDPGLESCFFLIAGHNGTVEGSYGHSSAGVERPEDTGTPAYDIPQSLTATCDLP